MTSDRQAFIAIVLGKLALVAISILSIKVSTKYLSPSVMGNLYLFTTIYTFFVFLFISPVGQYFNRYTHYWLEKGVLKDRFLTYFFYIIFVASLSLFVSIGMHQLGWTAGLSLIEFASAVALFVAVISLNQTIVPLFNMMQFRVLFTVLAFLTAALALLISFLLVANFDASLENWLLGILISNFLLSLLAWRLIRSRLQPESSDVSSLAFSYSRGDLNQIIKFSLPVAVATIFMWGQNTGYRITIESLIGANYLGFLGVGLTLASQLSNVVESILMQYLQPVFYKRIQSDRFEDRLSAANSYIAIAIPAYLTLAIFLTFSIEYVFPILVDVQYSDAVEFCVYGVWIEFFRMTTNSLANIAHSETKMNLYMFPYLFGAFGTNILVLLVPTVLIDVELLPAALVLGSFITCLTMFVYMRKIMLFSLDLKGLVIGVALITPSVVLLNMLDFPSSIDMYYLFMLFVSGCVFLLGWMALYFLRLKEYDTH